MPKAIKKPQNSPPRTSASQEKGYEEFVQGLEIFGIGLASCDCKIDRPAYFKIEKQLKNFDHEYELLSVGSDHFDSLGRFSVKVTGEPNGVPAASLECSFQAHMHGRGTISRQHAERFTSSELKLVLIPYARQFFSSISAQMSIPPVLLPLTKRIRP